MGAPDDLDAARVFGAIFQYPGTYGHLRDFTPRDGGAPRRGRHRHRDRRPADADASQGTRRDGRRHRRGLDPALRRADGLRRTVRGLHGLPRRPQAQHAGPHRRRLDRRAGEQGLPPRAPDARAAHPAREGDVERLHRAGASGQHGLLLRRLPRARGAEGHRPAHPPQDRPAGARVWKRGATRSSPNTSSTRSRSRSARSRA